MWTEGYNGLDIINALSRCLIAAEGIKEIDKIDYLEEVGKAKYRVLGGLDTKMQMYSLMANLCEVRTAN